MTRDDEILNSLLSNPNEMLSVVTESNTSYHTTQRKNPMKRNGGSVYTLNPSAKAMQPPINSNTQTSYYSSER